MKKSGVYVVKYNLLNMVEEFAYNYYRNQCNKEKY